MKIVHSSAGGTTVIRGRRQEEVFDVVGVSSSVANGAALTGLTTIKDAIVVDKSITPILTIATADSRADLVSGFPPAYTVTNATPDVGNLVGRQLTRSATIQSTALAKLLVSDGKTTKLVQSVMQILDNAATGKYLDSYVASPLSLARKLDDGIRTRIGSAAATELNTNLTINNGTARNPNLWCHDVYLGAFSVNSPGKPYKAATLISPNHAITCSHWTDRNNQDTFDWIDDNGTVISRRPSSSIGIINGGSQSIDIEILYFHSPITTITPIKTLPSDFVSRLPGADLGLLAVYHADLRNGGTETHVGVYKLTRLDAQNDMQGSHPNINPALSYGNLWPYSSGSPEYAILDTTPVLLCTSWHGNTTNNSTANYYVDANLPTRYLTQINAAMLALSTAGGTATYTLGTVDISAYPTY